MGYKIFIIAIFLHITCLASAQVVSPFDAEKEINAETDSIITEVITSKEPAAKEKIQYFSTLTRYGFKNLFKTQSYNSSLPYSSQVNPNAESFMQDYLKNHSKYLIGMKTWGAPYFSLIDNIFTQYGLPRELKYLAVIESGLSANATSWVGAGGPWQFMPYTARDYGLVVNGSYDERRDYYKSTNAAAQYLLSLYKSFHDWLLVVAAYNGGPGRVNEAIRKSGSKNFWDLQYYLPTESRNHVKKFIATHYIMEGSGSIATTPASSTTYASSFGSDASIYNSKPTLSTTEMENANKQTVSGKYNSVVIAKNIQMDIVAFNRFNPGFDNSLQNSGEFELILPHEKMQLFIANKYQILNECVQLMLGDNTAPESKTVYPKKYKRGK